MAPNGCWTERLWASRVICFKSLLIKPSKQEITSTMLTDRAGLNWDYTRKRTWRGRQQKTNKSTRKQEKFQEKLDQIFILNWIDAAKKWDKNETGSHCENLFNKVIGASVIQSVWGYCRNDITALNMWNRNRLAGPWKRKDCETLLFLPDVRETIIKSDWIQPHAQISYK